MDSLWKGGMTIPNIRTSAWDDSDSVRKSASPNIRTLDLGTYPVIGCLLEAQGFMAARWSAGRLKESEGKHGDNGLMKRAPNEDVLLGDFFQDDLALRSTMLLYDLILMYMTWPRSHLLISISCLKEGETPFLIEKKGTPTPPFERDHLSVLSRVEVWVFDPNGPIFVLLKGGSNNANLW